MREPGAKPEVVRVQRGDARVELRAGSRVKLHPTARADVMDLALADKDATIVELEQDFEDRVYVVVVIDDDPGRDLGMAGHPGHRFFFRPEEVEPQ